MSGGYFYAMLCHLVTVEEKQPTGKACVVLLYQIMYSSVVYAKIKQNRIGIEASHVGIVVPYISFFTNFFIITHLLLAAVILLQNDCVTNGVCNNNKKKNNASFFSLLLLLLIFYHLKRRSY